MQEFFIYLFIYLFIQITVKDTHFNITVAAKRGRDKKHGVLSLVKLHAGTVQLN